jgi:hypothetical protein
MSIFFHRTRICQTDARVDQNPRARSDRLVDGQSAGRGEGDKLPVVERCTRGSPDVM